MERSEKPSDQLRGICAERLDSQYPDDSHGQAACRLDHELKIIEEVGLAEMFGIAAQLGLFAREKGIYCQLAGAGGSSIVAYLCGLSEVEPLRHQLLFERFCDPAGRWTPAFVFRVEAEHHGQVQQWLQQTCGTSPLKEQFLFQEASFAEMFPHLMARSLGRQQGRAFDLVAIPLDDANTLSLFRRGADADTLFENEETASASLRRENLQFQLEQVLAGLVDDVDFESPDVLFEAHDVLERLGIEYQPTCLEDIVPMMVRDGRYPQDDLYVWEQELLHEPPFSPGPTVKAGLGKLLPESTGLILYEEQIMRLFHEWGGMELADGYAFVQAVKGSQRALVNEYRERFVNHAAERLGRDVAECLLTRIEYAAAESVCCKSEACAKAMTLYRTAYFKAHHRAEFQRMVEFLWPSLPHPREAAILGPGSEGACGGCGG